MITVDMNEFGKGLYYGKTLYKVPTAQTSKVKPYYRCMLFYRLAYHLPIDHNATIAGLQYKYQCSNVLWSIKLSSDHYIFTNYKKVKAKAGQLVSIWIQFYSESAFKLKEVLQNTL